MKKSSIIQFCSKLEDTLDECLFRTAEEDEKKGSVAGDVAKGTATVAAGGAGYLAHRKIMKDYGGSASGSVREAYRNAGRAAVEQAKTSGRAAVDQVKQQARVTGDAALKAGGAYAKRGLAAARKSIDPTLAKLRGALSRLV